MRHTLLLQILLRLMSKRKLPMSTFSTSTVSGLTLKYLIYFQFIFIYDEKVVQFDILHNSCSVFPTIYWTACFLFSPVYISYLFYCRLTNQITVGLFLGSLFCFIDLCICFVLVPYCSDCCSFEYNSKPGARCLQVCSFFSKLLWLFRIFHVSIQIS